MHKFRIPLAIAMLCAAVPLFAAPWIVAQQATPVMINETIGATTLSIQLETDRVFFMENCVPLSWGMENVQAVSLNNEPTVGYASGELCPTDAPVARFDVLLPDQTLKTYIIPVQVVMGSYEFLLLWPLALISLSAGVALLVSRRPPRHIVVALLASTTFIFWSGWFIWRTSFVVFNGDRYFSLIDDAMISMRYAWNFAHGNGLVWSVGERVEGYTNFLMVLVMSVAVRLAPDPRIAVLAIQVFGVIVMLALASTVWRLTKHIVPEDDTHRLHTVRAMALIGVLGYYPLVYWSLVGMETGLVALLLALALLALFEFTHTKSRRWLQVLPVFLGLMVLTRLETVVLAGLMLLYLGWHLYPERDWQALLRTILIFVLFPVAQLIFRLVYYSEFLPNTYALKVEGALDLTRLAIGWDYTTWFLRNSWPVLLLAGSAVTFRLERPRALLGMIIMAMIAYQLYVGGDVWPPYWRFVAPVMPLALLLAADELYRFSAHLFKGQKSAVSTVLVNSALLILMLGAINFPFLGEIFHYERPYNTQAARLVNVALALKETTTPDASVGVSWAGIIPYYSERHHGVDFLGKADAYIASLSPTGNIPGHNKYDMAYSVQTLQPTYIQSCQLGQSDVCNWTAETYVNVEYEGISMMLLRDSEHVHWDRLLMP